MKKLAIVLFLFCNQAYAGLTDPGKITSLQVGSTGTIYVTTDAAKLNPFHCTATTYSFVKEYPVYNEYYVLLLSAMDSYDDVRLRISDNKCIGGYPSIVGIIRQN